MAGHTVSSRFPLFRATCQQAAGWLAASVLTLPLGAAHADCRLELELLGSDLGKVKITQNQGQQLAPFVDEALRYCRTGHEGLAERSIEKARAIAQIPRRDELDPDYDWLAPATSDSRE
jgi:hypothetical protein